MVKGVEGRLFVFDFDALCDIGEQAVAHVATRAIAEQQALATAHAHNGPTCDGGRGQGHLVGRNVAVVGVVTIQLTATVAAETGLVLDGQANGRCLAP